MVNQGLTGFEEVIKCVIVGDSGVGKTCLTCAFACNTKYTLQNLVKTHQATVWAIDHYQRDKEVLDRSWSDVDGCQVSIRLWDTFGYHDKDRRFAYRGADVIILCFSLMSPSSLRNIHRIWYPEARRFSPSTPVVLCGTQADLRYLCFDDIYIKMEKGLLYRNISPNDLITPNVGREAARDIGAPYYETSVLTHHGVADVFINAARAALLERRKIKFWNTTLRRIQRPLIQAPMKIPCPSTPRVNVTQALLKSDISALINNKSECDVTFLVGREMIQAHRICLSVAAKFFQDLFSLESLAKLPAKRKRNQHLRKQFPHRFSHSDSEYLLDSDLDSASLSTDTDYDSSIQGSMGETYLEGGSKVVGSRFPLVIPYDHKAVETIEIRYEEDSIDPSHHTLQTYIRMQDGISPWSFRVVLEYLYTGTLRPCAVPLDAIRKTAEILQLTDLIVVVDNMVSKQDFLNIEMDKQFHEKRLLKLRELALNQAFLTDITFEVDNGLVHAHKALLMGRCEMMYAMFSSDFLESATDVIPFPGITVATFKALQEYLYTGESPDLTDTMDYLSLIEVANRLCLPRLVSMAEAGIVSLLKTCQDKDEMLDDLLTLLQPAELYNADQLYQFCLYMLSINFHEIHRKHHQQFKALPQDTQDLIEQNRWPPVWFLKECEQYERLTQAALLGSKTVTQDYNANCGCLCLRRRRCHRMRDPVELPI